MIIAYPFFGMGSVPLESEATIYDRLRDHINLLELHLYNFENLFAEIENAQRVNAPIEVQLEQLMVLRNRFNKLICLPGYKLRKAFQSFDRDSQRQALAVLRTHYDIVEEHWELLTDKLEEFETNPSMHGYWQRLALMNKWFEDFSKTQCNAVGYGYRVNLLLPY
jgi:hypothetical protein